MTPAAATSHLAGGAGHRLHSGDVGPAAAASLGLRGPSLSARAPPQTPKCLTLSPSGSPPDLAVQRPERPGNPASATAVQGLGPTLPGDGGGGHLKACGFRGKENPTPIKQLTFPSQLEHRPLPLPRLPCGQSGPVAAGGCGYPEGGQSYKETK